ncbi:uncharacterized protein METZ01_LOCUS257044, partial [marine metagenome]
MAISKIASSGITADFDNTLTTADLAPNSVDSSELVDGSIDTSHIADDQVTGDKLANDIAISTTGAITTTGAFTSIGIDDNSNALAMTIDSSEWIGIGTSDPKKRVHIKDASSDCILIIDSGGDPSIVFAENYQAGGQTGGNYWGMGIDTSENDFILAFDANSQASLSADKLMTVTSDGYVGIGRNAIASSLLSLAATSMFVTDMATAAPGGDYTQTTSTSYITSLAASSGTHVYFINGAANSVVGTITSSSGTVTYGTFTGVHNGQ